MLPPTPTHVLALKSATGTSCWAAPCHSKRLPTAMQASTSTQAAAHAHLIGHHVPQPITGQKQEVVLISACDHRYLSTTKRTHAVPLRHTTTQQAVHAEHRKPKPCWCCPTCSPQVPLAAALPPLFTLASGSGMMYGRSPWSPMARDMARIPMTRCPFQYSTWPPAFSTRSCTEKRRCTEPAAISDRTGYGMAAPNCVHRHGPWQSCQLEQN